MNNYKRNTTTIKLYRTAINRHKLNQTNKIRFHSFVSGLVLQINTESTLGIEHSNFNFTIFK